MKKIAAALLAVLVVVAAAGNARSQSGWKQFSPEGGNFSVLMPGAPTNEVENKVGSFGPYSSHLFSVAKSGTLYMVGWTDYAPNVRLDGQGEITANRDNYIKSINGTLLAEKEITLEGHPGIEFTAEMMDAKFFVISRIYLVGNRPYQIVAVTKAKYDRADANRFLWSFKLDKNSNLKYSDRCMLVLIAVSLTS